MTASATARNVSLLYGTLATACIAVVPALASPIAIIEQEHVTGGVLDLAWENGFGVSNNMRPVTLTSDNPAYMNPSGDHTVASATNSAAPDSGGIILTAVDPMGASNYAWEAWIFTGDGSTRRGLVVRADPTVQDFGGLPSRFISSYQLVIQSGLFQINFRKVLSGAPTTLRTWFASQLPAGSLPVNTWHKMKVIASGTIFRCFIDDFELTALDGTPPVDDAALPTGWVGVYNFSAFTGGVPFYTDDLTLSDLGPTPAHAASWGSVKTRWTK